MGRVSYNSNVTKQINPDLTDEQKRVLLEKGTEMPFSGSLLYNDATGIYTCVNCGKPLFRSETKYESTTPGLIGWPSFSDAIEGAIADQDDTRYGMNRSETVCANCGAHLGHFFEDPSSPNGKHFCINSASLGFTPAEAHDEKDKAS